MTIDTGLRGLAALGLALALGACGGGSGRGDTDDAPRSAVSVTVLSAPAAPVPAGGTAEFVMQVANTGSDAATRVRVVDEISGNLAFRAAQCAAAGGAVCPADPSPAMTIESLPAGGSLVFTVSAVAASNADGAITNTMTATAANDPDASDDSATAVGRAFATSVSVATTAPAGPLAGGAGAAFTVVVANAGPSTANAVALTVTPNGGLALDGTIACTASGGAQCPATVGTAMTAPLIPAGGQLTLTIAAVANAGFNGNAALAVAANAAGDTRTGDDSDSASVAVSSVDLGVSLAASASESGAGRSATFIATVANPGPASANSVTIRHTLSGAGAAGAQPSIVCRDLSTNANCWGAATAAETTLAALPSGRALQLTITVPVAADARGPVTSTVAVAASGDPDASNNQASASTAVVDARNGGYQLFSADGRTRQLAIDFDAAHYSVDGGAPTAFTAGDGDHVVTGAQRLRVGNDVIVGLHDFGGADGVQPFVAARRFGTTLADAQGQYNLVERRGGSTRVGSAAVGSDGMLYVCLQDSGVPVAVGGCPQVALRIYSLSVSDDVYTATPRTSNAAPMNLRVALSGGIRFLVGAESGSLTIGLVDPPALPGGTLHGPGTPGDWLTLELKQESYVATRLGGVGDSAQLLETPSFSSSSMRIGARRSDNARIYVLQAGALAVVAGHHGDAANGLLQIALP